MFKLSSDHCIFTEYKFFVVRWHIFIAQWLLLVESYLGFIEGGMYIIYIITIVRNIVKLLCQNMHWKFPNFKRKMNCMTAIDLISFLSIIWHFIGLFCKENKIYEKKSILCQWHIKMSITSKLSLKLVLKTNMIRIRCFNVLFQCISTQI